jgi:hypothetical protein
LFLQTVQYIQPHHAAQRLGQAELLVIDEAAAIPLPMVKAMLGPYLVFLCSTGERSCCTAYHVTIHLFVSTLFALQPLCFVSVSIKVLHAGTIPGVTLLNR